MKRTLSFFLSLVILLLLAACSGNGNSSSQDSAASPESSAVESSAESSVSESSLSSASETSSQVSNEGPASSEAGESQGDSHILIAYFTLSEDVDTTGVDAVTGASVVVEGGEVLGNVEFLATIIQDTVGGDLFQIETVQQYPLDHDPLVEQAAQEQAENARPELASSLDNLEQYDTVLLGCPNWWGDLPMPLYTFLEEYDLSGKTVIPFCTLASSDLGQSGQLLAELAGTGDWQEGIRFRSSVSKEDVQSWIEGLGL